MPWKYVLEILFLMAKIRIYFFHVLERKRVKTLVKARKNVPKVKSTPKVHYDFIIYTKNCVKYIFEVPCVIEIWGIVLSWYYYINLFTSIKKSLNLTAWKEKQGKIIAKNYSQHHSVVRQKFYNAPVFHFLKVEKKFYLSFYRQEESIG